MDRAERAAELHRQGYNCSQAVACVLAEAAGVDEKTMYRIAEGFGAGMGTAKGVCGALSGAAMIAGLMLSDGDTEDPGNTKAATTKVTGAIQRRFVSEAGALICRDIKTGNDGAAFTSCSDCIRIAVRAAEEILGI